jgi:hypothetical protein
LEYQVGGNSVKLDEKHIAFHLIYAELIQAARYHGVTTYQKIAHIGGLHESGSIMAAETGQVLELISQQESREGRPMLSALCVGVSGIPGDGFFGLAERLGKLKEGSKQAKEESWKSECAAVYAAWQVK